MKQDKATVLQVIEQQMKETQRHIKTLQSQQEDLLGSIQAMHDITNVAVGSEILVPITNGIFVKGTLHEKENVIVNIGAQTAVTKTVAEARELLEQQYKEVEQVVIQLTRDLQELYGQAQQVEQELAQ